MVDERPNHLSFLPSAETIRSAAELYLRSAYHGRPTPRALKAMPPAGDFEPAVWLMDDPVERTPSGARIEEVRMFALRLGNRVYHHMKLCICRPGDDAIFVFMVDAHDAVIEAPPGTPDHEAIEELKRSNVAIASEINTAWEAAGLKTEKRYLKEKVRLARVRMEGSEGAK